MSTTESDPATVEEPADVEVEDVVHETDRADYVSARMSMSHEVKRWLRANDRSNLASVPGVGYDSAAL